jgi:phosphate-selective porin OprO/OprP
VAPAAELTLQEQIDALKARLQELDSKVRPLQRAEAAAGDKGYFLSSPDAEYTLRIRGVVQLDSRWFFDKAIDNDAFVLRRSRIGLEGKAGRNIDYQVVGEFSGQAATILDANILLTYAPEFQVRLGRFKSPVGLEMLQSETALSFLERSFATQLVPNRDIGVQVGGDLFSGKANYAVGVFNGVADGGNNASQTDANDGKSVEARVMFQPWVAERSSWLAGLSFGLAGTYGLEDANGSLASSFRTDGQQVFYAFRTSGSAGTSTSVSSNGHAKRFVPQLSYYRGPFGLLAEYAESAAEVKAVNVTTSNATVNSTRTATLRNRAWQVQFAYVLTGEEASYKGVVPTRDFDRATGSWGALEVVGRVSSIHLDAQAFTGAANAQLADPSKSAAGADTYGVGLNWYLSKFARFGVDYEYTRFRQAAGAPAPVPTSVISHPEHALLTRFGLNF